MKNKLRILICYLLLCTLIPMNYSLASVEIDSEVIDSEVIDREEDGINIDDIVYHLSQTDSLSEADIRNLLYQIAPINMRTADEIAAGIMSVTIPGVNETFLTLPSIPTGFTIAIHSSSNTGVISTNGVISPPTDSTIVELVFTVTRMSDNSKSDTSIIAVTIPGRVVASSAPEGYIYCAAENGTCIFTGTTSVAFGANGVFNYVTATTSIACSNDVFGDPIGGVQKFCYYAPTTPSGTNVASAVYGATASASSSIGGFSESTVIDGDRLGVNWGSGGGWNDATGGEYPDWVQVDFDGTQSINEIDVYTLQDNFGSATQPIISMTFNDYGIIDFIVQYWDGETWVTVTNGNVIGNNKVWRQFTFLPVVTDAIRVTITNAPGHSRVVELEAWTSDQ